MPICVCSVCCKCVYSGLGHQLSAILNLTNCTVAVKALYHFSPVSVTTVSEHLDNSGRLSREAAADGQPLSKASMVACGQNRCSVLHIVLHYTPFQR